jgi:hypothetical protein
VPRHERQRLAEERLGLLVAPGGPERVDEVHAALGVVRPDRVGGAEGLDRRVGRTAPQEQRPELVARDVRRRVHRGGGVEGVDGAVALRARDRGATDGDEPVGAQGPQSRTGPGQRGAEHRRRERRGPSGRRAYDERSRREARGVPEHQRTEQRGRGMAQRRGREPRDDEGRRRPREHGGLRPA